MKQSQLMFPLLAVLEQNGPMRARDAAEAIADRVNLDESSRNQRVRMACGRTTDPFQRSVRWIEQKAKLQGLTARNSSGLWTLGPNAQKKLTAPAPNVVVRIFETADTSEYLQSLLAA